jgi:hypothetical protein
MCFGRAEMADSDAQGYPFAQARVRQEHIAVFVDEIDEALVRAVEFSRGQCAARRIPPETHDAQRDRRQALEVGMRVHPRRKLLREPDVFGDAIPDAAGAEGAEDHPEFQRPETAAQLDARVHEVFHRPRLRRPQDVLGRQREGRTQNVHSAAVEHTDIDRREQPLVRVHDQRIRALGALQDVGVRRQDRRHACIGGVYVQPELLALADIGDVRHRIDARR